MTVRGALLFALWLAACSDDRPPVLLPIDDQVAVVGSRLDLRLSATDPEGDPISYAYECPGLDISDRAALVELGSGAVFWWTPTAPDLGEHRCDFTASDGIATDIESISITVRAGGQDTAPIFRKPLGEGTTLDLSLNPCLELEVLVEDRDSLQVSVRQDPAIAGSSLAMAGLAGTFAWCPSQAQAAQPRFTLRLVADDHDNPPVRKDYTILIRAQAG